MLHGDRQHTAKYRGVARSFRARCSAKEGSWMHSKPCIDLSAPVAASQEYILEVIASGMAVRNVDEHGGVRFQQGKIHLWTDGWNAELGARIPSALGKAAIVPRSASLKC